MYSRALLYHPNDAISLAPQNILPQVLLFRKFNWSSNELCVCLHLSNSCPNLIHVFLTLVLHSVVYIDSHSCDFRVWLGIGGPKTSSAHNRYFISYSLFFVSFVVQQLDPGSSRGSWPPFTRFLRIFAAEESWCYSMSLDRLVQPYHA